jgi:hypothetical protein
MEMLLGLGLEAADDLQPHADDIIGHFHGADMDKAGHQRAPDRGRMRPHLAGALVAGPSLQGLEDLAWDAGERFRWYANGSEGLKFRDFRLQMLHARG